MSMDTRPSAQMPAGRRFKDTGSAHAGVKVDFQGQVASIGASMAAVVFAGRRG